MRTSKRNQPLLPPIPPKLRAPRTLSRPSSSTPSVIIARRRSPQGKSVFCTRVCRSVLRSAAAPIPCATRGVLHPKPLRTCVLCDDDDEYARAPYSKPSATDRNRNARALCACVRACGARACGGVRPDVVPCRLQSAFANGSHRTRGRRSCVFCVYVVARSRVWFSCVRCTRWCGPPAGCVRCVCVYL